MLTSVEKAIEGGKLATAVIPAIETKVSLGTDADDAKAYIREGYAFSPMFTLGVEKEVSEKEVVTTWLSLAKAN